MKAWKKIAVLALIPCLSTACGSGSGTTPNPPAQTSVKEKDKVLEEPTELVIYSPALTTEDKFYGEHLKKKFPNYSIKFIPNQKGTTLAEMVASGTIIDIFFHAIGSFETDTKMYGLQYDMTEMIKKRNVDLNRIEPTLLDAIRQLSDGKIYSLPVYANNLVMFYNKEIFDKFGVAYPKDGMTWEETFEISKKLTRVDGGMQYFGFAHVPNITVRNSPMGIPIVDSKTNAPTINKDSRWMQFFRTLFVDAVQDESLREKSKEVFVNGRAFIVNKNIAMNAYLFGMSQSLNIEKPFEWDMVSLPIFKGSPVGSQITPVDWGITNQSKNKEAAMEVLKYLTSDEFQIILANAGLLPVLKSETTTKLLSQSTLLQNKNYKAVLYNKPAAIPAKTPYDTDLISIYGAMGTEVLSGSMDINTALRQGEEKAVQKITEIQQKQK